jgi:hypothetical protein
MVSSLFGVTALWCYDLHQLFIWADSVLSITSKLSGSMQSSVRMPATFKALAQNTNMK